MVKNQLRGTPKAKANLNARMAQYRNQMLQLQRQQASTSRAQPRDVVATIPAATAITTTNVAPQYLQGDHGVTVKGRDLITTIAGNADFSLKSYDVNPGQFRLFPVLSDRARNYEQYRVKSLTFEYIPLSGTDRSGSIYLCFNPESTTPPPRNEQTLSAMSGSQCGAVYGVGQKVTVKNSGGKILYVRSDILSGGQDLRTTDFGKFFVAVTDCSSTSAMGKVYVNYEVELRYPRSGVPSPMVADCIGATTWGSFFDDIYNGNNDTIHSTSFPVNGPDLAYFNSSGNLNYIYFRKPGTYLFVLTGGQSSINSSPFSWSSGTDAEIIETHRADGTGVGVVMWWTAVQVNKPNGWVVSSNTTTTAITTQPHIVLFEISEATNNWLRAN